MPFSVVTPPTFEPVSVELASLHARALDKDYLLVAQLIKDARAVAENYTQRVFPARTVRWTGPGFYPVFGDWRWESAFRYVAPWDTPHARAKLSEGIYYGETGLQLLAPVSSVTSIGYYDAANVSQTLSTSDYTVDLASEPAVVRFNRTTTLPQVATRPDAVFVDFVAGYPDIDSMPAGLVTWILSKVSTWYSQRESIETGGRLVETSRNYVDVALDGLIVATRFA